MMARQYLDGYEDGQKEAAKYFEKLPSMTNLQALLHPIVGWECGESAPQSEYEDGYCDAVKKAFRDQE